MSLDRININSRPTTQERPQVRERPDDALRTRPRPGGEQGEGGEGGTNIRALIDRLKQADIDPRKKAEVGARIRNFLQENGEEPNSDTKAEFNPRKTIKRIVQSDLSAEDKRGLVKRVKNYVAGQTGDNGSSGGANTAGDASEALSAGVARPSLTVA